MATRPPEPDPEWADEDGLAASDSPASSPTAAPPPPHECCVACLAACKERSDGEQAAGASPASAPLSRAARARKVLRTRILNFTPSWFSVNMGTGVVSILLHELPYQFRGLGIISNIVFALNVVLFVAFLLTTLARYLFFRNMLRLMLLHPAQSLFTGTFPMALGTIVNMTVLSLVPAWGHQWAYVAWTLWFVQTIVSLLTCIGLPFLQFTRHELAFSAMAGTWLLPIVAPVVSAASGSVVSTVLPPAHARFTLIVAYILWGTAVPTSLLVFGILWARLAIHKIPPGNLTVSAFLPVGPCGLGGFAVMNLASVQRKLALRGEAALGGARLYDAREQLAFADAVYAGSIVLALVMWGFGLVWLTLAIGSVCDMAYIEGGLAFNMGWWGLVFPLGVFALSTNKLSMELDSGALRVIATVLTLAVLLLWLVCISLTTYKASTGELFHSPCLAAVGGEPPTSIGPSRQYSYTPRPPRNPSSTSRSRSVARAFWSRSTSRGRRL